MKTCKILTRRVRKSIIMMKKNSPEILKKSMWEKLYLVRISRVFGSFSGEKLILMRFMKSNLELKVL